MTIVSQAEEQKDTGAGGQNAVCICVVIANANDDDGLPVEAHLKIGCVLRTGELGDGFSLLRDQLEHLQQSKGWGGHSKPTRFRPPQRVRVVEVIAVLMCCVSECDVQSHVADRPVKSRALFSG